MTAARRPKSLLILSATAGAGHVRAGDALAATAAERFPDVDVRHEDVLNFTSPLFKRVYSDVYFSIVDKSPELWGVLYKKTEFKGNVQPKSPLVKLFDRFNFKSYLKALEQLAPDAVLCTHFLPYAAIADLINKPGWRIPFYAVPTDYDVHSLWINPDVRRYYTATSEGAWTVASHGIPAKKIVTTGIPVMPEFARKGDPAALRRKHGIPENSFTVMVLSGGYGIGVIDRLVPSAAEFLARHAPGRCSIAVVCGKNKRLYDRLSSTVMPRGVTVRLFPFVTFVNELMECADLLLTKSGGLTVSEALAKSLPMMIFDPIPGQEGRNADYLIEHGAAIRAANFVNVDFKLKQLLDNPAALTRMRRAARKLARPRAAGEILESVLSEV